MTQLAPREAIWFALGQVPRGKVVTYGELAQLANLPGAARFAGSLLKQLPPNSSLPWHRVINAQGRISLPPDSPEGLAQMRRLRDEGVTVVDGKISLARFGWLRS